MFKKFILASLFLSSTAFAGQSLDMVCIQQNYNDFGPTCLKYDYQVTITSDRDTGLPGAFGVAIAIQDQGIVAWSETKGFVSFHGGDFESVDGFYDALPYSKTYSVFKGTEQEMCNLTGMKSAEIYAGHGSISMEDQTKMNELSSRVDASVSIDHLRKAFIQHDVMKKDNGKSGLIYSLNCDKFMNNTN